MTIALIALITIAAFVAGFLLWKSRDSWRWFHITATAITFILSIVILFPTAGVLKSRRAWNKVKEDLEKRLETIEAEQKLLKYGDPSDPAAGEGVLEMQNRLRRYTVEAGRRWTNLRMQNNAAGSLTLAAVTAQEALPPGVEPEAPAAPADPAAPQPPLIPQGLIVYGFAETPVQGVASPVPTFFLGEFRVTASAPNQVTLAPTNALEQAQVQAIGSGRAQSWSLYEMLPLDGHEPFIAVGSEPSEDQLFGRVDEELVRNLLGQNVSPATLNEYLRDGSRTQADDKPSTRWLKIEFVKPHTIVVDSPEKRNVLDGGFFDGTGQAVDSRLQRGETGSVSFKTADQIVVKEEAGLQLIDEGVAKLLDTYFVRELNDYRFVLRRIRLRISELAVREQELLYEKTVLEGAINATINMLAANQEAKLKLENDLAKMQAEKKAIEGYTSKVKQQLTDTRQELVGIYKSNLALAAQLTEIHSRMAAALP